MVAKSYKAALARVLVHEGGYVNHPRDPGGATNQGITQRTYDAFRRGKKLRTRNVRSMTVPERDEIYRHQYWDAVRGDKLPEGVDYVLFDGAVHSGPKQSIKWMQRALGSAYRGKIDGVIGLGTLAALDETENLDNLIDRICDRRMIYLRELETWGDFGRGWKSRVDGVRAVGRAMADSKQDADLVELVAVPGAEAKALIEDARKAPSKAPADAATGGGIGAGGISATLQTLQDQLTPFSSAGGWITNLVVILAVGGAVLAAGGMAYRWYASRQQAKIDDALDQVSA